MVVKRYGDTSSRYPVGCSLSRLRVQNTRTDHKASVRVSRLTRVRKSNSALSSEPTAYIAVGVGGAYWFTTVPGRGRRIDPDGNTGVRNSPPRQRYPYVCNYVHGGNLDKRGFLIRVSAGVRSHGHVVVQTKSDNS